jgi:hypothetical protein
LLNKDRLQLNIMNNQVVRGDVVGYAAVSDTAMVNKLLRMSPPKSPDPSQVMKLAWGSKSVQMGTADGKSREFLSLHALRGPRDGKPKLDGSYITDARQDFDMKGDAEVSMQMNAEGAQKWKLMTGENVGKQVAIVLDGYVVSAPNVMGEIPGGRSSISMGGAQDRNKQLEEATDLANVLKAGALPRTGPHHRRNRGGTIARCREHQPRHVVVPAFNCAGDGLHGAVLQRFRLGGQRGIARQYLHPAGHLGLHPSFAHAAWHRRYHPHGWYGRGCQRTHQRTYPGGIDDTEKP